MAEQKSVLALLYDFDKTLCTKDMQEFQTSIWMLSIFGKNQTHWHKRKKWIVSLPICI